MSERKVLTKYYPPDFDPSQLGRSRGPKKGVLPTIRLETPFSMRCTRCGSFIPKVGLAPHLPSLHLADFMSRAESLMHAKKFRKTTNT
jgi:hypothetical protein